MILDLDGRGLSDGQVLSYIFSSPHGYTQILKTIGSILTHR